MHLIHHPARILLLCGLLLLGKLPVLQHMVSCGDDGCGWGQAVVASLTVSHGCCSCADHGQSKPTELPTEHDSEQCSVCQSLYTVAADDAFSPVVQSCGVLVDRVALLPSAVLITQQYNIASPRGPPVTV